MFSCLMVYVDLMAFPLSLQLALVKALKLYLKNKLQNQKSIVGKSLISFRVGKK